MSKTVIPVERKTISAFIKDKLKHGRKHCNAKTYVNQMFSSKTRILAS